MCVVVKTRRSREHARESERARERESERERERPSIPLVREDTKRETARARERERAREPIVCHLLCEDARTHRL